MKKSLLHSIYGIALSAGLFTTACKKPFLDIVPDNVVTLKNAFANRTEAEKYLYTCYGYLPDVGPVSNILFFGADDMWTYYENNYFYQSPWKIARGDQNVVGPWVNFWDGENHAKPYFKAIRDCNIFLENMMEDGAYKHIAYLGPDMQKRWIAEVKFLKAYYHFYLLRMYGPIPITDKSLPVSATPEQVKVKRDPVDKVVDYIVGLLDEAAAVLPEEITNRGTELGRVTKPAALMLKAKLLTMAASPLFNGNPDYAGFKDKDGQLLFNPTYDAGKWEKAVAACEAAIKSCEGVGIRLYQFTDPFVKVSPATAIQMSIRGSVTEKWNTETIWALSGNLDGALQRYSMVDRIDPAFPNSTYLNSYMAPTMKMAETFYSKNGVPINEDKTWDYGRRYETRVGTYADRLNVQEGYTTANLNFDRENRFYASLAFDGCRWFMQSNASDENAWNVKAKFGQPQGKVSDQFYSQTGYWPKKLVNWKFVQTNNGYTSETYPWPEMRLADLYLLYAEGLNETGKGTDAITWLDKIRKRAGLDGVVNSWSNFSTSPGKFSTKEGLRDIIHQERMIELCFEGSRNWDLRRWKEAVVYQNKPVLGWDVNQRLAADYYRPRTLFQQTFIAPRDYFWPLKEYDLTVNTNLVQNPGW
ncbi:RagB/SusD family nutrient uptake outer membrane protein [Chitinophaga qingshengii]|uniref:RagB/SusD family nutrient uptake outer membrane protein n=1 Tax=Chitinophaga qingshengii TaxID=1569794 RepID=A0ABR7TNU3_9BACT|nr:RagB/SusD family nutrient uptake outer membrane protein [Chitinophaga qingshengii]MBC9932146.1 RagB/SusD family nutrient uptake outer membrane protein [Chitinophaga qingshengii]